MSEEAEVKFWHARARPLLVFMCLLWAGAWSCLVAIVTLWRNYDQFLLNLPHQDKDFHQVFSQLDQDWNHPRLYSEIRVVEDLKCGDSYYAWQ